MSTSSTATVFAALGDETRLRIVSRLSQGPASITKLTGDFSVTRQAVSKHLRVMEQAGLVRSSRHGRESLYQLDRRRLDETRSYLELISKEWDNALERLRTLIEDQ